MVSGNGIHDPFFESLAQRFHIFCFPKRRIHLESSIVLCDIIRRQGKMMRADFCRHRNAFFFCHPHQVYGSFRGTVAQVQVYSGIFCQKDIPCSDDILHRIGNSRKAKFFRTAAFVHDSVFPGVRIFTKVDLLTVGKHFESIFCSKLHRFPIDGRSHDGFSILGNRDASSLRHTFQIRQFFSFFPYCDCSKLDDVHRRFFLCPPVYLFHLFFRVNDRFRVRHGTHRRHSASGCCLPSCLQRFLICQSRVSEMHVQINKSWHDIASFCIQLLHILLSFQTIVYLCVCSHFFDPGSAYQDIAHLISPSQRIQHMSVLNPCFHRVHFPFCIYAHTRRLSYTFLVQSILP